MDWWVEATMNVTTRSLEEARSHLKECLASQKFLEGNGLGSQLPIFVAAIEPKDDLKSEELCLWLVQQSKLAGIEITTVDIFEELVSSLKTQEILEVILQQESENLLPQPKLIAAIRAASRLSGMIEIKLGNLKSKFDTRALLFSGLGSAFPYFRINDLIVLLEKVQLGIPVIVIFPGNFASTLRSPELSLFSKIPEHYNYRAIDIYSYEP